MDMNQTKNIITISWVMLYLGINEAQAAKHTVCLNLYHISNMDANSVKIVVDSRG